jgi:hypothetical protein
VNTVTSKGQKQGENIAAPGGRMVYSRHDRKSQIEDAIRHYQAMSKAPLSMRQIARRVNMSASAHLMTLLWDMVDDGTLVAKPRPYRTNMTAWDFSIPSHKLHPN